MNTAATFTLHSSEMPSFHHQTTPALRPADLKISWSMPTNAHQPAALVMEWTGTTWVPASLPQTGIWRRVG